MIHLTATDTHLIAKVDVATEATLVSQVPGSRYLRKADHWRLPKTYVAHAQLVAIAGRRLEQTPEVETWACIAETHYFTVLATKEHADEHVDGLRPHQNKAVAYMDAAGRAVVADEPGVGKTPQAAVALVAPALVICPSSLPDNWQAELATWRPELTTAIVRGSAAARRKIIESRPDVLIIGMPLVWRHSRLASFGNRGLARCVECVTSKDQEPVPEAKCEAHPRELNERPFATVIIDEAHEALSTSAKQTLAVWAVADQAERVFPMTGTPVRNQPSDLWAMMRLTHPQEWPVKSKFINRYCELSHDRWGRVTDVSFKDSTKAELDRLVDVRFLRRTKAEVLPDLPPKVYSRRPLEMEGKQLKAYRQMSETMLAQLDNGSLLVAPDPMQRALRLLQFAAATPVDITEAVDFMGEVRSSVELGLPSCKVEAMLDLASERRGLPTVAFSVSKQVSRLIGAALSKPKLGYRVAHIDGDVDPADRGAVIKQFQAGELDWLLCTYGAAYSGITLTVADTMVRVQRPWSIVQDTQAEDRIHRIGQESTCHYIDLVTRGTPEPKVLKALEAKSTLIQDVCRDEERLRALLDDTEPFDLSEAA